MKKVYSTLLGISTIALFILVLINIKTSKKVTSQKNNFSAISDSIKQVENKLGEKSFVITTLESQNVNLLKHIDSKDKEIQRLKVLVDKYKKELKDNGSATVFTDSIVYFDTIPILDNKFEIKNNWIHFKGLISDSLKFKFQTSNQYSVILGYEGKWYQKKKPFTLITNLNPYSEINTIRSYRVKVQDRKWRFNITGGYGATYSNNQIHTGPSVVAGFGYTF